MTRALFKLYYVKMVEIYLAIIIIFYFTFSLRAVHARARVRVRVCVCVCVYACTDIQDWRVFVGENRGYNSFVTIELPFVDSID